MYFGKGKVVLQIEEGITLTSFLHCFEQQLMVSITKNKKIPPRLTLSFSSLNIVRDDANRKLFFDNFLSLFCQKKNQLQRFREKNQSEIKCTYILFLHCFKEQSKVSETKNKEIPPRLTLPFSRLNIASAEAKCKLFFFRQKNIVPVGATERYLTTEKHA